MAKSMILFILIATACLTSCSSIMFDSGDSELTIVLGSSSISKGLSAGWPSDILPVFSKYSITVSAPDLITKQYIIQGDAPSLTISVPLGLNRKIDLIAYPDWPKTQSRNPLVPNTSLVKSYRAYKYTDVSTKEGTSIVIRLSVNETMALIPSIGPNSIVGVSLANFPSTILKPEIEVPNLMNWYNSPDFSFDTHGRLYITASSGLYWYMNLESGVVAHQIAGMSYDDIAVDEANSRVYGFYHSDGTFLRYYSVLEATPQAIEVSAPPNYDFASGGLALSSDGFVFIVLTDPTNGKLYLSKIKVLPELNSISASELVTLIPLEDLGLSFKEPSTGLLEYFTIEDMQTKDEVLIITSSDVHTAMNLTGGQDPINSRSRGKVLGVSTKSLIKLWEGVYSGDANNYPLDPLTEAYGPRRIIGLGSGSVYFIDEGFIYNGLTSGIIYVDKDRVIEIDVTTGKIRKIYLEDEKPFFNNYSLIEILS